MLDWIEAQSTPIIALLIAALCFLLAAVAYYCAALLSRRPIGEELKAVSPVTLTPLAVLLGLLIAFIAGRIWENVANANDHVGQEIRALSEVVLLSAGLPQDIRTSLRAAVRQHITLVEQKDWPAMADLQNDVFAESASLKAALSALLSFRAVDQLQEFARQRGIQALERAIEARADRIRLSRAQISPVQWAVIVLLAVLILITIAVVHIGKPAASVLTLFIFSTAMAACLVLLLAYDRPFAAGGISMTPAAYREINFD
jgi:hypothetical protein